VVSVGLWTFAKEDRVVRLQVAELAVKSRSEHDVVAEIRGSRSDDPQVLVIDVVQENVVCHTCLPPAGNEKAAQAAFSMTAGAS
jgi:hypothetical protein